MIVQKKQKYEAPNLRRNYTIMSSEELSQGKKSFWSEIEISGGVRNLSSELFNYTHLTTLYLSDNNLSSIPAEICRLSKLTYLDASSNKICEIPKELGKMTSLRELILNHNFIAHIPYELGKLYQLITFSLKNNPLDPEFQSIYSEKDGSAKLLSYLLDKNPFSPSCPFPDR